MPNTQFRYFDAHSHIASATFETERDELLARMRDEGVGTITVGVDRASSEEAVQCAQEHEGVYATIGLHPCDTPTEGFDQDVFTRMVRHPKVVAIGECGLDYFRTDDPAEKKRQRDVFEAQIHFAITHLKPLMLHCRPKKGSMDAYLDTLDILEPLKGKVAGNVHFFVGNVDVARRFYDLNFTTSFTGVVTFAREYDDVVRFAPVDMILTETDAPYAAPHPFRGKRSDPCMVRFVVQAIAGITRLPEEKLGEQIVANAIRVFGLGPLG